MFSKLNWFIAYKYLVSRQENSFVSFIALISTLGVALGIAILIIVMTVLNGFKQHIESTVFDHEFHLTINYQSAHNITETINKLKEIDDNIMDVKPLVLENGLLTYNNYSLPVTIASFPDSYLGLLSTQQESESSITSEKNSKQRELTQTGISNKIDISTNLAKNFNLESGDKVIIASPVIKNSMLGPQPRFKKFNVHNIIDTESVNYINSTDIVMDYNTALKFLDLEPEYISNLYVSLKQPLLSEKTRNNILASNIFDNNIDIKIWQDFNQNLFHAIKLERISIIILLLMIITIACFNILSGLYIQVSEKQKDIAILRNLGLKNINISSIFLLQGIIIAIIGGVIGVSLGIICTLNLDSILYWLQQFNIINSYNSFFNAITMHTISLNINYFDTLVIFSMSLLLCVIATVIPARKSSKVSLIEVLRNE
jgi:lipoprotein-releasing system permease protein